MQETFTRREVAKMIHNMVHLAAAPRKMVFDAWSETVVDDNGGFIMDSLLDMGDDNEIFKDPFGNEEGS